MVRGKIEVKRIENTASRQVTFSKRRNGLLKKACELSILCDAEVALIIFSQSGKLYEFSSSNTSMQKTIEKYMNHKTDLESNNAEQTQLNMQQIKSDMEHMSKKIQLLEITQRKFLGQELGSCSVEELQEMDDQMERSLSNIREGKAQLFKKQIEELQKKERQLLAENTRLHEKVEMKEIKTACEESRVGSYIQECCPSSEVETELAIGLPVMRAKFVYS